MADTVDSSGCKYLPLILLCLSFGTSFWLLILSIRSCVSLHLHILDTCCQMLDKVHAVQLVLESVVPLNCDELCPGMGENYCTLCYLNSSETCF